MTGPVIRALARGVLRGLAAGSTVLAGRRSLVTHPPGEGAVDRERIGEIVATDEPDDLRLARIQAHVGVRDAARDILAARRSPPPAA